MSGQHVRMASTGEVGSMHDPERMLDQIWRAHSSTISSKQPRHLSEGSTRGTVYEVTGKWARFATVCCTVKRLGLTRQKLKRVAIGRSEVLRGQLTLCLLTKLAVTDKIWSTNLVMVYEVSHQLLTSFYSLWPTHFFHWTRCDDN